MDRVDVVRRMWDAWAQGDLEHAFAGDADTEWRLENGKVVLRGREEAMRYIAAAAATGERREITVYGIQSVGDSVVVDGAMRRSLDGHLVESQLTWVYRFDEQDRLRLVSGHASRAEAMAALTTYA
jgi:ketosteroid isomerase-like protein